jgi:hypothetical protein
MKKALVIFCSVVFGLGLVGCVGKAPIGKGKAPAPPPVVTKG